MSFESMLMISVVLLTTFIVFAASSAGAYLVVHHPQPPPRLAPVKTSSTTTTLCAESPPPPTRRDFCQSLASSVLLSSTAAVATTGSFLLFPDQAHAAASAATTVATSTATAIDLPRMGLGAWAWGDSLFWGYDSKNDDELKDVFDFAVAQTSNSKSKNSDKKVLLDTAEIYGFGRSEMLIGQFAKAYPQDKIQVATKFAALPFRTKASDVVKACQQSMTRLERPIDLYQIHFPNAWSNAAYWDGLAMAYEQGLVKAVGVSNYGVDAMRACHDALAQRGIPLASNQIQLSLLYTHPVDNGLLQACNDLGVKVLSYSPLALGMLTGKYSVDNPPSGPRKSLFQSLQATPDYDNLLATMRDIAGAHGVTATPSQVALNWTRAKNTIPIPGARTLSQVQQNYAALDWDLSSPEVAALDKAAVKVTSFIQPEASPFPKQDINTHLKMFDS